MSENDVQVAVGLVAAAAFARPMRQRILGRLQRLLQRWRGSDGGDGWVLPTGDRAEPSGPKESDLVLVWVESESASLDEGMVRDRWPDARQIRQLGANCFLFRGVRLRPADQAEETLDDEMPAATAEQLMVEAAQNGDLRKKSAALSDLGVLSFNAGDYRRAAEQLTAALEIVQRLGDQLQECDVLGNLGMAVLASRDGLRATELFKKELALARLRNDRFAEKLALEHMAILWRAWAKTCGLDFFLQSSTVFGPRVQRSASRDHVALAIGNSVRRVGKVWRGHLALRVGGQPDARSGQPEGRLVRRSSVEISIESGRKCAGQCGRTIKRIVGQRLQRLGRRGIRIARFFLCIGDKRPRYIANGPDGIQRDVQIRRVRFQEGEQGRASSSHWHLRHLRTPHRRPPPSLRVLHEYQGLASAREMSLGKMAGENQVTYSSSRRRPAAVRGRRMLPPKCCSP